MRSQCMTGCKFHLVDALYSSGLKALAEKAAYRLHTPQLSYGLCP